MCVGFNVGVEPNARQMAEDRGVEIRLHSVIYELIDEVRSILEGRLEPERREVVTGHAEVRQLFRISRVGTIAGSYVLDGVVERSSRARLTRDGTVVFDGPVAGLKRFKDDVREAREGFECGIKVEGFDDVRVGDRIEVYRIEEVARKLEQG
jgi:translation initiation factor IF-2